MDLAEALWIYTPTRWNCKHLEGAVLHASEVPTSSWASHMKALPTRYAHLVFSSAVLVTGALHAAELIDVQLVRGGKNHQLSDQTRTQIADRLPKLFATCSLNSRDHPNIFASWGLTTIWVDTEAKDHLKLRLPKPIDIRTGDLPAISVREFLLGIDDPKFPGPEISRAGEDVVAYVKCSGGDAIKFVCMPEVKAVMPSAYHDLCRHLAHTNGAAQPTLAADAPQAARR